MTGKQTNWISDSLGIPIGDEYADLFDAHIKLGYDREQYNVKWSEDGRRILNPAEVKLRGDIAGEDLGATVDIINHFERFQKPSAEEDEKDGGEEIQE